MAKRWLNLLAAVALAVPLFAAVLPAQTVQALDRTQSTGGALRISEPSNYRSQTKQWDSPGQATIKTITISKDHRPYSKTGSQANYNNDDFYIYYRRRTDCATCWQGPLYNWRGGYNENQKTWDMDITGYGDVIALRTTLNTGYSAYAGQRSTTVDIPSVVTEIAPFQVTPRINYPNYEVVNASTSYIYQYSNEYRPGRRIERAHVLTDGMYGRVTLQGLDINGNWYDMYDSYSYANGYYSLDDRDWWIDLRSRNIQGVRLYVYSVGQRYGVPARAWIPDVQYSFGGTTTPTFDVSYWNTEVVWDAGRNPAGTTYEVWRRTLNEWGGVVADDRVGVTTGTSFTTTDQTAGRFYKYRIRTVANGAALDSAEVLYWTSPNPTVSIGQESATLSWPAVGNGVTHRVLYYNGSSWQLHGTTQGNSYWIGGLSPAVDYQFSLEPTLPNGGVAWWNGGAGGAFTPTWRAPGNPTFSSIGQSSVRVSWNANGIAANQAYRVYRSGALAWEGVGTAFTDGGLAPNTWYGYKVCALNNDGVCGAMSGEPWVVTAPIAPNTPSMQVGSYAWSPGATGWAKVGWNAVPGATEYRVYGINGGYISVGGNTSWGSTSLTPGTTYTVQVSAVSASGGESNRSGAVSFTPPWRRDGTSPTATVLINNGQDQVSGNKVSVKVTGSDTESKPYSMQLSNNNSTWSEPFSLQNPRDTNLIAVAGGNPLFTDLAGWGPNSLDHIWATVENDGSALGGKFVRIRWDGGGTRWSGLRLAKDVDVEPQTEYTVSMRYRVQGLTQGMAAVWSHYSTGSSETGADKVLATATTWDSGWQIATWTVASPADAKTRWVALGFDQANNGATLDVDYIVMNEGNSPTTPTNDAKASTNVEVPWTLGVNSGTATVYAKVIDAAGNSSSVVSDTIKAVPAADVSAPKISVLLNGGADTTSSNTVTLDITGSDDQTPLTALLFRYSNDGVFWSDWENYKPRRNWTLSSGYGRKTVWVQAQDGAYNTGTATANVFYVQSSQPVLDGGQFYAEGGTVGNFNSGGVTYTVTYMRVGELTIKWNIDSTNVRQVRYGFDPNLSAARWETFTPSRTFSLPPWEGMKTLYAQLDSGQMYMMRFILDTVAPNVTTSWSGNATVTRPGGQATIVLQAEDNISNVDDLKVRINGGAWQNMATEFNVTLAGSGTKSVRIEVKDPAGNVSIKTLMLFVLQ